VREHHSQSSLLVRAILAVTFLLALAVGATHAQTDQPGAASTPEVCVSGTCFVGDAELPTGSLPIRGAGTLTYLGFKVYSAALYARPDAAKLVDSESSEPLRLVLHYHRKIAREDINKSTLQALSDNPNVSIIEIRTPLDQMITYHQDVNPGDRYELTYEPGKGMRVLFNGVEKGVVLGDDFARAYLGMWLSEHPLSKSLREKLIGEE
jgi:hypothetical protein